MSLKGETFISWSSGCHHHPFASHYMLLCFLATIRRGNAHLQRFVTAADVGLVDEDVRNAFLPGHLKQHLLVVGSILCTKAPA